MFFPNLSPSKKAEKAKRRIADHIAAADQAGNMCMAFGAIVFVLISDPALFIPEGASVGILDYRQPIVAAPFLLFSIIIGHRAKSLMRDTSGLQAFLNSALDKVTSDTEEHRND